jgi:PLP dependent protein
MGNIAENLGKLRSEIPDHVKLIAVSKTQSAETIMKAYHAGQRIFGENKAQELIAKAPVLPDDIEWHFIGHLQTNKIRQILPYASLIHSVDSLRLLEAIGKEALKLGLNPQILLQFHIAEEETKFGLSAEEAAAFLDTWPKAGMEHVKIRGVMGMATFTDDENIVSREFSLLHDIFNHLKCNYFQNDPDFCEISMGMSDDFPLAIAQGSTMVRIGTMIFGHR